MIIDLRMNGDGLVSTFGKFQIKIPAEKLVARRAARDSVAIVASVVESAVVGDVALNFNVVVAFAEID